MKIETFKVGDIVVHHVCANPKCFGLGKTFRLYDVMEGEDFKGFIQKDLNTRNSRLATDEEQEIYWLKVLRDS